MQTITPETRRKLALGLTIAPPKKTRNRRRKHVNHRVVNVAATLFVAAVIFATGWVVSRIH